MVALGLANIASGIMGGIPASAVLARTSLNIKNGATSRMSGIINVLCVTVISLALLQYFKFIPLSVIASIVGVVAVRMVEVKVLKHMLRHDRQSFLLAIVVGAMCIIFDPTVGIMVGVIIALFDLAASISKARGSTFIFAGGIENPKIVAKKTDVTCLSHFDSLAFDTTAKHLVYKKKQARLERALSSTGDGDKKDEEKETLNIVSVFIDRYLKKHHVDAISRISISVDDAHMGDAAFAKLGRSASISTTLIPFVPAVVVVYQVEGGPLNYLNSLWHSYRLRKIIEDVATMSPDIFPWKVTEEDMTNLVVPSPAAPAIIILIDLHQVPRVDMDGAGGIQRVVDHVKKLLSLPTPKPEEVSSLSKSIKLESMILVCGIPTSGKSLRRVISTTQWFAELTGLGRVFHTYPAALSYVQAVCETGPVVGRKSGEGVVEEAETLTGTTTTVKRRNAAGPKKITSMDYDGTVTNLIDTDDFTDRNEIE